MRAIGLFNLAALVASLMVLAITAILVPEKSWGTTAFTSSMMFALAVGFIFYAPALITKRQSGNDATQIAALGSISVITGSVLLITAGSFAFALLAMDKAAVVLDIFAVGFGIVGGLMLRAATTVVDEVSTQYAMPSKHIGWKNQLQGLHSLASNAQSKMALATLSEKFRYAASDLPGGTPQDQAINDSMQNISDQIGTDDAADIQSQISKIETLLAQREVFLRSARNKT